MNTALFVSAITTAVTIGLGCGTSCSPFISTFLSTYSISHSMGIKKSILSFISFFFGKLISITILCTISSLISMQFINDRGYIGSFNLRLTSQIMMSMIGMILLLQWLYEMKKKKRCGNCTRCNKEKGKAGFISMLAAGITYGASPCAPLLLMISYCFTMPIPLASMTGIVFSLSSMVSPIFVLVVISGALSKKMYQEIPDAIKWFRLGSYIFLMIIPFFLTI